MSDLMLIGALRMPVTHDSDPLTLKQYIDRGRQAADEIERLERECVALSEQISKLASAQTRTECEISFLEESKLHPRMKAGCIGEFTVTAKSGCSACHFHSPDESCEVCGGDIEYEFEVDIPWDTQKQIWKKMNALYADSLRNQLQGGMK